MRWWRKKGSGRPERGTRTRRRWRKAREGHNDEKLTDKDKWEARKGHKDETLDEKMDG